MTQAATLPAFAVAAVKKALHDIPMNATVGVQITDVGWAGRPVRRRIPRRSAITWAPFTRACSSCWPRR